MSTPVPREPHDDFVAHHRTMDERLEDAFQRYEDACSAPRTAVLSRARFDLALLLWLDAEPPLAVRRQLAIDAEAIVEDTPPLT